MLHLARGDIDGALAEARRAEAIDTDEQGISKVVASFFLGVVSLECLGRNPQKTRPVPGTGIGGSSGGSLSHSGVVCAEPPEDTSAAWHRRLAASERSARLTGAA
jgi:hypothetical protein